METVKCTVAFVPQDTLGFLGISLDIIDLLRNFTQDQGLAFTTDCGQKLRLITTEKA
jgi:hypothetical protein